MSRVPSATLTPGTRLGRYEIIGELGTGGMATVYFGRALAVAGFQRLVAIKYLHPHLLKDAQFVQMFLDEGRLAARILHPNVVSTLDLEHTSDGLYIVMEYVEGDQLLGLFRNARAASKRIPFGVTMRVALDVLNGLHAAHELTDDVGSPLRIVHRDVSPHNILVGTDGVGRITDFGIAKAEERISDTRDGVVKGKLSYMAPEQSGDGLVDRRADVFSAATVIWECLTGRRLFPGRTDGEVLRNLLQNPIPRLRDVDPELPQNLDDILARALSREASQRYASAHEFAEALELAAAPTIGIAPTRLVARYVREVASAKVNEEQRQRRAHPTQNLPVYRPPATPSQIRTLSLPPAQGEDAPTQVQHSSAPPASLTSESSIDAPAAIPSVPPPPNTPAGEGASAASHAFANAITEPLQTVDPHAVTQLISTDAETRDASPGRSVLVFVAVLILGTLAGSAIFFAMDSRRAARPEAPRALHDREPVSVVVPPPPPIPVVAPAIPPEALPPVVVAPLAAAHPVVPVRPAAPRAPVVRPPRPVAPVTPSARPAAPVPTGTDAHPAPATPSGPPPLPTAI